MRKLSEVIAELEADATQREKLAEHGSAMSSRMDDHGEWVAAKAIREIIEKLKRVDSL